MASTASIITVESISGATSEIGVYIAEGQKKAGLDLNETITTKNVNLTGVISFTFNDFEKIEIKFLMKIT